MFRGHDIPLFQVDVYDSAASESPRMQHAGKFMHGEFEMI